MPELPAPLTSPRWSTCSSQRARGSTVIDRLLDDGVPVDSVDPVWGGHPLRTAAANGRPASVRRLLARGANPDLRDPEGRTPLDLCRAGGSSSAGHAEVESILPPVTGRSTI